MDTAHDDELAAENGARRENEYARNVRLREILGLSEINHDHDSEEVVAAKLLERAGVRAMIATLVSTPLTGYAEVNRRGKLRALRADGWIPEEEEGDSPPGNCDPEKNSQPQTLRNQREEEEEEEEELSAPKESA
jgi:hypothetical protein